ncbi:MAG: hypothetical protein RIQ52_473 [Pseudomonadota bacterium]|jgi:IS4 transposase
MTTSLLDWYRACWEIEMFFLVLKESAVLSSLYLDDSD